MKTLLATDQLTTALALTDLTETPEHAISLVMNEILTGLSHREWPWIEVSRGPRVVRADDNYGLLGYRPDEVTLSSMHTRWVTHETLLRTQMTSLVATLLPDLAARRQGVVGLALPGMVYRRDVRDRWHCAEPHQMDLWILMDPAANHENQLEKLMSDVLDSVIPGAVWRALPSLHPYTQAGRQVEVQDSEGHWLEVLECGLMDPGMLARLGIDPSRHRGLAMGLGLDRLVMLRKGLTDIRWLRDPEPRVAVQMLHLGPWQAVSRQPVAKRDLSICVAADWSEEELTERALVAAGEQADWVEALLVKGSWSQDSLPEVARCRLGMKPGQVNVLLSLHLRHASRSIERAQAQAVYDRIYAALHQGVAGSGYGAALSLP